MIKKIGVLIIACVIPSLHAENCEAWLEIKPGYFFFSDCTLRQIYHHGGPEIQVSLTYPWCELTACGTLALYGSLGYLHVNGRSLNGNQKTSISQIPFDLGVRAIAELSDCIAGYLSIGPRFFHFHQQNDSIYVDRNICRNGVGFFINGGCNFFTDDCFLFGLFGEYAFEQKSFTSNMPNVYGREDIHIGGFTFGASVGLVF